MDERTPSTAGADRRTVCCPECGKAAHAVPPASWTPAWGPRPAYSHHDGEPLCPVMTDHGYRPAAPIAATGTDDDATIRPV